MTREELIAYDRWLTENKWGSSEIITPEQAADLYLAKHPLPPAEGAEEILEKHCHLQYNQNTGEREVCSSVSAVEIAMQEFAALHAQRIAEKMVSERLRGELSNFVDFINNEYCDGNVGNMLDIEDVVKYFKGK